MWNYRFGVNLNNNEQKKTNFNICIQLDIYFVSLNALLKSE